MVLPSDALAWDGWIGPGAIVDLVRNTAPFVTAPLRPDGLARLVDADSFERVLANWESILSDGLDPGRQLEDYFALCMAAHHATVGTFVPTDVDTKIRGLVWRRTRDLDTLRRMCDFALSAHRWRVKGVTARATAGVSGHDGEWMSVMLGAHGRLLSAGDAGYADKAADAVDAELGREADVFRAALMEPGREIEALCLCASLTHNAGDVDQGISFWESRHGDSRGRFGRLAHENTRPYGGWFHVAAELYRAAMAAEGHRNYPLRGVKGLRRSADLLLPPSPFLDDWGALVARHPALEMADRAEVVDALVKGCRKIPGQAGYHRALAGFAGAGSREFEAAVALAPASTRKDLREPEMRKQLAVPRASFESARRKQVESARRGIRTRATSP
jgi:hypothetical protein